MSISVFKPFINRKDMDSVLNCLVNEKLENGIISKQVSSELSEFLGVEEGFLLKEYRRSIEIVFKSVEAPGKNLILLSPLSPIYYKLAAESAGLEIIYVDIDPETACVSFEKLSDIVNTYRERIHSVIIDSPLGYVPEIEKISEMEINIIEDISNSLGASAGEKRLGSFGNFVILNMDSDKKE